MSNSQLLAKYSREPSRALREEIFASNKKLCFEMAHDFASRGVSEPFEDLVQLASIGLWNAIEKFDSSRGAQFHTYAGIWMRNEIFRHIRDRTSCIKISRTLTDIYEKGRKVERQLKQQQGYADDMTIAELVGVSLSRWMEAKASYGSRRAISLDEFIMAEGVDDFTYDGCLGLHRHHLSERIEVTPGDLFLPDTNLLIEPVSLSNLNGVNLILMQQFFFEQQSITKLKKRASQLQIPRFQVVPIIRDAVLSLNL